MPRSLAQSPEWLLMSLTEMENSGEKDQTWGGGEGWNQF